MSYIYNIDQDGFFLGSIHRFNGLKSDSMMFHPVLLIDALVSASDSSDDQPSKLCPFPTGSVDLFRGHPPSTTRVVLDGMVIPSAMGLSICAVYVYSKEDGIF